VEEPREVTQRLRIRARPVLEHPRIDQEHQKIIAGPHHEREHRRTIRTRHHDRELRKPIRTLHLAREHPKITVAACHGQARPETTRMPRHDRGRRKIIRMLHLAPEHRKIIAEPHPDLERQKTIRMRRPDRMRRRITAVPRRQKIIRREKFHDQEGPRGSRKLSLNGKRIVRTRHRMLGKRTGVRKRRRERRRKLQPVHRRRESNRLRLRLARSQLAPRRQDRNKRSDRKLAMNLRLVRKPVPRSRLRSGNQVVRSSNSSGMRSLSERKNPQKTIRIRKTSRNSDITDAMNVFFRPAR
jgi:hypothetical protein